jgi:4-amino-4-deoxy-L-arabinose transferase-like glycosyltransferase
VFWTRVLPRRPGAELVFGVVVALGLLSKVNFVFVPVALGLAAASLPELRARLRPWGLAVSLAVVVAICLWPMIWALQHPEVAFASARKLRRDVDLSLVAGATRGLASFVSAVVGFGILPAVVLGFFRWRNGRPGRVPAPALPAGGETGVPSAPCGPCCCSSGPAGPRLPRGRHGICRQSSRSAKRLPQRRNLSPRA